MSAILIQTYGILIDGRAANCNQNVIDISHIPTSTNQPWETSSKFIFGSEFTGKGRQNLSFSLYETMLDADGGCDSAVTARVRIPVILPTRNRGLKLLFCPFYSGHKADGKVILLIFWCNSTAER